MFEKFEHLVGASLSEYSTMKVGGEAKYLLFPKNVEEIAEILKICEENHIKTFILGNGSNVLFSDKGFNGAVVSLKKLNKISFDGEFVFVDAGVNLFALNIALQKEGLSGLEWSYGIPASVGGFLFMNGGCFGHEISEFVEEVSVLDGCCEKTIKNEECGFSYRNSDLQKYVILGVKLRLKREKTDKIMQNMQFFLNKKRESQPCDLPSLGSVFKIVKGNPDIYPAKLIDNMGLKGVKIKGAEVSQKHAGFIVNSGGATSSDILALIEFLESRLCGIGVKVEREIIVLKEDE